MKKPAKLDTLKLKVNTETVRALTRDQLLTAQGGVSATCQSVRLC